MTILTTENPLQTNSFQMVLATDEVYTYAIFNYININWSAHTEAGGDTTGGEGGVPAYVSIYCIFIYFIALCSSFFLFIYIGSRVFYDNAEEK